VTYPEFYNFPNSDELLVFYRSGHSGRGSEFASHFDATTGKWTSVTPDGKSLVSGRIVPGVNGDFEVNPYLYTLVFDVAGNLHMTWNWRTTMVTSGRHRKSRTACQYLKGRKNRAFTQLASLLLWLTKRIA
jgi:hypothetical protein